MYRSTKTFGHELGLSACFRQWRATESHCSKLHGYALAFTFVFEAKALDERNWVQDFGGLKQLKQLLVDRFDHKTMVAEDGPWKDELCGLTGLGLADVVVVPAAGCEAFAQQAYTLAAMLYDTPRVRVVSCEVREHGANSAIYIGEKRE